MTLPEPANYLTALNSAATLFPNNIAVVDDNDRLTYRELLDAIDARAANFLAAGLSPGGRVAIIAENSVDYLVTVFAIWRSLGVVVTIFPSSGAKDLTESIESSDPSLVVVDRYTESAVRNVLGDLRPIARHDRADSFPSVLENRSPNPDGLRAPLALVCYTSGTTSRPKAVMVSMDALVYGALTYARVWRLSSSDTTVVCLPMTWLYGLNTTSMATLSAGGTVAILRRARPEMITDAIVEHHGTVLAGVTTMFAKVVQHLSSQPIPPDLSSLRLCVSGGEPRNEAAFDRWTALTGCPVHDTFCASECFPLITYDPQVDPTPVRGSAGKLVPGALLKVVGPDGREVHPGGIGEALAWSPGLMLGYWGDEEQTSKALTDDGFYRQKDLVRVDADGYVYVVGRISDMIIRGGSNISPAEVERVLREHPTVRDVAVVGLPDDVYGQRVTAAVLLPDGVRFDPEVLSSFASTQLSSFKLPSDYVVLDEFPVNKTTGKVDRKSIATALEKVGETR